MDFDNLIAERINDPSGLERLYRTSPEQFTASFSKVFSAHPESITLKVWNERLNFKSADGATTFLPEKKISRIFVVILLALLAGFIMDLPKVFKSIETAFPGSSFYFSVLPALSAYFIIKNWPVKKITIYIITGLFIISYLYIEMLPAGEPHPYSTTGMVNAADIFFDNHSDSIRLAYAHMPFFLWSLVGLAFIGMDFRNISKRMDYLRYNGEAIIYTAIILICGIILTLLTWALFEVIKVSVMDFYEHVIIYGTAASFIVATYLTEIMGKISKSIAPIIAKIFSPLVLITLLGYLITIIILRKNPYNDREFLITFNVMLVSVLAITIFAISERGRVDSKTANDYIIASLVLVALIIDAIALSAIAFRLASYGVTPNRIAVLGANILIFINLLGIVINYARFFIRRHPITSVEVLISQYLPVYSGWTVVITFGFPFIFSFK